jgi:mannose-6-phosphate isomerase-like protein (cupin superfamily)
MFVTRAQDAKKEDLGLLRGDKPQGVTIKWLFDREMGDESYGHDFSVKELECGGDKEVVAHSHEHVEACYVVSGRAIFQGANDEEVEVGPGDLVITYRNEPHMIKPADGKPFKMVVCNNCYGNGDNCSRAKWIELYKFK